jgi:predicted DNA binding CopG/RHH family protein
MKDYDFDKEEQQLLDDYEAGEFVPVENVEAVKRDAIKIAKNSLNKTMNINIRLSERDVYKLKARAAKEGLPYQTLAASILHQSTSK